MTPSAEFKFPSSDGLHIACRRWDSRGPASGVVQIAHGMGEHIGRYSETIDALLSAGFTVYGNDHRGHGQTAPSKQELGDFGQGGFDLLVEDMNQLTRIAKSANPGLPFILLGHSMGSFAAQQHVLDHSADIDALILSGSGALDGLAGLIDTAPPGTNFLNAAFEPARTPFDWLTRDTAVVDAFIDDPLCFAELQPGSYASFLAAHRLVCDPARLARIRGDLPVYVFSGSEDPVGQRLQGVRTLIQRYDEARILEVAHDFYSGGRHEMLNEINRHEVLANLLCWINGVVQIIQAVPVRSRSHHNKRRRQS
jgi:alpha-beta hydrolase superfamily lysophospholipase